jgi:hypothetical protein
MLEYMGALCLVKSNTRNKQNSFLEQKSNFYSQFFSWVENFFTFVICAQFAREFINNLILLVSFEENKTKLNEL